jgi:hypothetical protein
MRQNDITIGGTYRVRIGDRLAPVTVLHRKTGGGRARFVCETHDTRRQITATAARLRPVPGTMDAEREGARRAAAAAAVRPPRAFSGSPGTVTVEPVPVRGMLDRIDPAVPVLRLSQPNAALVHRAVDACHVAESFGHVARAVRREVGRFVIVRTIPRDLRRGILHAAAVRHAENRSTYREVMGHAPLPSERMVAEAVGIACGLGPMPR